MQINSAATNDINGLPTAKNAEKIQNAAHGRIPESWEKDAVKLQDILPKTVTDDATATAVENVREIIAAGLLDTPEALEIAAENMISRGI